MNTLDKTLMELHDMLKFTEVSIMKTHSSGSIAPIFAIGHDDTKRKKNFHPKGKGKG